MHRSIRLHYKHINNYDMRKGTKMSCYKCWVGTDELLGTRGHVAAGWLRAVRFLQFPSFEVLLEPDLPGGSVGRHAGLAGPLVGAVLQPDH